MRVVVGSGLAWAAWAVFAGGCGGSPAAEQPSILNAGCDSGTCGPIGDSVGLGTSDPPEGDPSSTAQSGDASISSVCVPTPGPDLPDDGFVDSNCDGIDGDKSRAIFVAPTGSDTAPGSFGEPVQTVAAAVKLAVAASKDVYVCDATYPEAIQLSQGTSLYGGYDCTNGWQRMADVFVLAPPSGIPLTLSGIAQPMTIDHARLIAADAVNPGTSSIASLVASSTAVSFHQVTFQAGLGAAGANGASAAAWTATATQGASGASFTNWQLCLSDPNDIACVLDVSGGSGAGAACEGLGGHGSSGYENNGGAYPSPPGAPDDEGTVTNDSTPSIGTDGATGAASASGVGTFSAAGYSPTNAGATGLVGGPGQGGVGGWGGATTDLGGASVGFSCAIEVGGGGGQGGGGGCGGAPGGGGAAGGASIGLVSFQSGVQLSNSSLDTSAGGTGGSPGVGAPGQAGGAGGVGGTGMICDPHDVAECGSCPTVTDDGAPGAPGAAGGHGGAGGAGGGGPSIGLVSVGIGAVTDAVVFNISAGGAGGAGMLFGPDGAEGLSTRVLAIDMSDAGNGPDGSDGQ